MYGVNRMAVATDVVLFRPGCSSHHYHIEGLRGFGMWSLGCSCNRGKPKATPIYEVTTLLLSALVVQIDANMVNKLRRNLTRHDVPQTKALSMLIVHFKKNFKMADVVLIKLSFSVKNLI